MPPLQDCATAYDVGTQLDLYLQDSTVAGGDALMSITIERHLKLSAGCSKQSQVVMATLQQGSIRCAAWPNTPPVLSGPIVAKIFDLNRLSFSDGEWKGTKHEYCTYISKNEVKAYSDLGPMNGKELPSFYGRYICGEAVVVLLELITYPTLEGYSIKSSDEGVSLTRAGQLLIEKLHSKGVYHCDFQRSNLFWESSSSQLRVIDFELAQFRDNLDITESLIESWKNSDRGEMDRIMVECGVPDGRPNRLSSNGKSGSMMI